MQALRHIRSALLLLTGLAISSTGQAADTADNFDFPARTSITDQDYQLCSTADMQVFAFVDLGDVALYLEDCEQADFLNQGRLLHFYYRRDFDAEDFRASGKKLLERNLSESDFKSLEADIDDFNRVYQSTSEGDQYIIGTDKNGLLNLYLNGEYIGGSDSRAFSKAYFEIWFGKDPFREGVKKDLTP